MDFLRDMEDQASDTELLTVGIRRDTMTMNLLGGHTIRGLRTGTVIMDRPTDSKRATWGYMVTLKDIHLTIPNINLPAVATVTVNQRPHKVSNMGNITVARITGSLTPGFMDIMQGEGRHPRVVERTRIGMEGGIRPTIYTVITLYFTVVFTFCCLHLQFLCLFYRCKRTVVA